jgi:integrase
MMATRSNLLVAIGGQRNLYRGEAGLVVREFIRDMRLANRSKATIDKRVEVVERLRKHLDDSADLLTVTADEVEDFQATFSGLAPASVDVYTRHLQAFFAWAQARGHRPDDPSAQLIRPRLPKGRPHPMHAEHIRILFAATTGVLRVVFSLALLAGLRRGEICELRGDDIEMVAGQAVALIHGKGGKERLVPFIRPLMEELHAYGIGRGYVVTRGSSGKRYDPDLLSLDCHRHLRSLGIDETLHSLRHTFATYAARMTKDPLFVRDLLGHESVATTEIYMDSDMSGAHLRLAPLSTFASELIGPPPARRLRVVDGHQ